MSNEKSNNITITKIIDKSEKSIDDSINKPNNKLPPGLDYGEKLLTNQKYANSNVLDLTKEPSVKPSLVLSDDDASLGNFIPQRQNLLQRLRTKRAFREQSIKNTNNLEKNNSEKQEKTMRPHERSEKSTRSERSEKSERLEKSERSERSERSEKTNKSGNFSISKNFLKPNNFDDSEKSENELKSTEYSYNNKVPSLHGSELGSLNKNINDVIDNSSSSSSSSSHSANKSLRHSSSNYTSPENNYVDKNLETEPPILNAQQIMKRKREALLHIRIIENSGYEPFKTVNMSDTLEDILEVEEELVQRRSLQQGVKFAQAILLGVVGAIEYVNNKFNPFDIDLDGWSEQVFECKEEYNEVLGELYVKYAGSGVMAPEIKLLVTLGQSAFMYVMSKKLFGGGNNNSTNYDEILKSNPKLKELFEQTQKELSTKKGIPNTEQPAKKNSVMNHILGMIGLGGNNNDNPVNNYAKTQQKTNVAFKPPQDPDGLL